MATLLHRHEFLIFYRRFTTGAFSLSLLMNQLAPDLRCMGRAGIASSLLGIADFLAFRGEALWRRHLLVHRTPNLLSIQNTSSLIIHDTGHHVVHVDYLPRVSSRRGREETQRRSQKTVE